MSAKNVETLRAAHESWNGRDFQGIVRNAAEGLVYTDHAQTLTLNNPDKFREWTEAWAKAFSEGRITNPEYIDAADVVVAQFTVAAERFQIWQASQVGEALRCDAAYVPEQIQVEDGLEPGEAGESIVAERPVNQQVSGIRLGAAPVLQHWEVVQEGKAGIRHESPTTEAPEPGFPLQRLDGAVACRRTHQVHALELIAKSQIGNACIRDTRLPRHFECSEVRQMAERLQSAIGELAAGILAQIQMLQLRHPAQMEQPVVSEFPRPAQAQAGDMIELGDARQHSVRHQPVRVQRGNSAFFEDTDQLVPVSISHPPARPDPVFLCIDGVRLALRRRASRHRLHQRGAQVSYHDPHVPTIQEDGITLSSQPLTAETLRSVDCVMIITDHNSVDYQLVKRHARATVDTRHVLPREPKGGSRA